MTLTDKQFDRLKGQYNIDIPAVATDITNFSFYARTSIGTLYFTLRFWEDQWYGTVKLGLDGELRNFRLITNMVIFNNYSEYALLFIATAENVALDGLSSVSLKVLLW